MCASLFTVPQADVADEMANYTGSCTFISGDLCGYIMESTNEKFGWDLLPSKSLSNFLQYTMEIQENSGYGGK